MTPEAGLDAFMERYRRRLESALEHFLPGDEAASPRLAEAMRYAVFGSGKRFRPVLTYAACERAGGPAANADVPAAAVELIHAYSLVHDDLPAMDDDDLRRGEPTCHRAFDEATAVLAGDTLHTLAFEVLANRGNYRDDQRLAMIRSLSSAAGMGGMAAGQSQDMLAQGRLLTVEALEEMHYLKTGRLITAALELGALAADAAPETRDRLRRYGNHIGLAFQIQDDILDVTATTEALGKPTGSDDRHQKSTFPELMGLEASRKRAETLAEEAIAALGVSEENGEPLARLARFVVSRTR
jgi:geranylgeranyl pyrophosphate synthase